MKTLTKIKYIIRHCIELMLVLLLCGCKFSNPNQKNSDMNSEETIQLLKMQLMIGAHASNEITDIPNGYIFTIKDINVIAPIIKDLLIQRKYEINEDLFKYKLNNVFHLSADEVHHINLMWPQCENKLSYDMFEFKEQQLFIIPDFQIIISPLFLPEIIDYQKLFPEIAKIEDDVKTTITTEEETIQIVRWKDIRDIEEQRKRNIDLLLYRNKYLFNDDKASLEWLLKNDKIFLEQMIRVFGFDTEYRINRMVLKEIDSQYRNKQPSNIEILNDLFVYKDCQGNLQIRKGLMQTVADETDSNQNNFFKILDDYCFYLAFPLEETQTPFSFKEKCKIIAYINNITYPLYTKYKEENGMAIWDANSLLYNIYVQHPEIIEEITKNNYFDCFDLKTYISNVEEEYRSYILWKEVQNEDEV